MTPPHQLRQTLHHLDPPVLNKKKKRKKHPVYSTLSDGYATAIIIRRASYSQRLRGATHINASPPPSSLALNNHYQAAAAATAAKNISKAALPESAHRQDYLISIELFQMKKKKKKKRKKGVSHSPGLFCVLARCVGSLFMIQMLPECFFFFFAAGCVNLCCCCCSPPPREEIVRKKKGGEVLLSFFQRAGVAQVTNYFVHRHLCCFNNMLIWCYCVRWKGGGACGAAAAAAAAW